VSVAIEMLARKLEEGLTRETTRVLSQRLGKEVKGRYDAVFREDIYWNTLEVIAFAERLRELREEIFSAV